MASQNLKPRTLVRPQHLTSLCSRFMRTKFKPARVLFSNCIKIQILYVLYTIRYKEVRSLHRDFATERFKKIQISIFTELVSTVDSNWASSMPGTEGATATRRKEMVRNEASNYADDDKGWISRKKQENGSLTKWWRCWFLMFTGMWSPTSK